MLACHRTVLHLQQDPSSEHLGTTVWDASIVMAKYFEKVCDCDWLHRERLSIL